MAWHVFKYILFSFGPNTWWHGNSIEHNLVPKYPSRLLPARASATPSPEMGTFAARHDHSSCVPSPPTIRAPMLRLPAQGPPPLLARSLPVCQSMRQDVCPLIRPVIADYSPGTTDGSRTYWACSRAPLPIQRKFKPLGRRRVCRRLCCLAARARCTAQTARRQRSMSPSRRRPLPERRGAAWPATVTMGPGASRASSESPSLTTGAQPRHRLCLPLLH
jgi:hypothetical protein